MKESIVNVFKDIWNSNILDLKCGIKSKWIAKKDGIEFAGYPWDICLQTGLFCCLVTKEIRNKPYFTMILRFILNEVFKFAKLGILGKPIMLYGDELVSILREKKTMEIIDQTMREGRSDKIGIVQVVQYRNDIPDSIVATLTHNFIFQTSAKSDLTNIKSLANFTDTELNEIKTLGKFQCFATGDFILYDANGRRYSNNKRPVKIVRTKPPNALNWGGK